MNETISFWTSVRGSTIAFHLSTYVPLKYFVNGAFNLLFDWKLIGLRTPGMLFLKLFEKNAFLGNVIPLLSPIS